MQEAYSWLAAKKPWKAKEHVWSIHATNRKYDRAGKATAKSFRYISHEDLEALVSFDLLQNNFCLASGRVWNRLHSIPMGGSFSAQAADLHSVWCLKKIASAMRGIGKLVSLDADFPLWSFSSEQGEALLSMAQFRDNVMIASNEPPKCPARNCSSGLSRAVKGMATAGTLPLWQEV